MNSSGTLDLLNASNAGRQPAFRSIARMLRDMILAQPDGAPLGSESELLRKLGVSRPTLRQAARVLEHQQLLTVRTGLNGGYYGRRPDIESVASAAALYLRVRGTSFDDLLLTSYVLSKETYRLAANSKRATERKSLRDLLARLHAQPCIDDAQMLREEGELRDAILALAASPPLELFLRTLYAFGLHQTSLRVFQDRPKRVTAWRSGWLEIADAILAGDANAAIGLSERRGKQLRAWISAEPAS